MDIETVIGRFRGRLGRRRMTVDIEGRERLDVDAGRER